MHKLSFEVRNFRRGPRAGEVKWPFPLDQDIRLACLSDNPPDFGLSPFFPESAVDLEGFQPNVLIGSAHDLSQLAEQIDLGTASLGSIDHAVIVLTRCGEAPVSDVERVILWQAFGVPVYEIYAGFDNTVLAYECELHEGWHLTQGVKFVDHMNGWLIEAPGVFGLATGLTGFRTEDPCPCGRPGGRLLNIEQIRRQEIQRRWAAIA